MYKAINHCTGETLEWNELRNVYRAALLDAKWKAHTGRAAYWQIFHDDVRVASIHAFTWGRIRVVKHAFDGLMHARVFYQC